MSIALAQEFARRFAEEWIAAWNSHDLDRVLRHYAPEVELTSPFVERITGEKSGTIRGHAALRDYFSRALEIYPDLKFTFHHIYAGVQSMVIEYQSIGGLRSAELLEFDEAGQVCRIRAHYASASDSAA